MSELSNALGFNFPDLETVESVLWIYPDQNLIRNSDHIVLLVAGKDNSGFGAWSWSYAAQLPKDNIIPATISLPKRNTADLNLSGKYIASAVWLLKKRYPDHKISILAHSMGNMATAWALHYRPTFMSSALHTYIALGAPFKGTAVKKQQPAILQTKANSAYVKAINSKPFPKKVKYLSIISATDEIAGAEDPKALAAFPAGTCGEVVTPQAFFNTDKKITHVGELADNGIYHMALTFLNGTQADPAAAETDFYPELQMPGLDLTIQYGATKSHVGDADLVAEEPVSHDSII
jgi:pimeloyl-ACP methyl ester carboxylesterase